MLDNSVKNIIDAFLTENENYILSLRQHLHTYPELSGKEYETAKYIEKELDSFSISHERIGDTGVYGIIDSGKPGKTIILRADIDALPISEKNEVPYKSKNDGIMHACGHDAHTATLISTCKFLSSHKDLFNGCVKVCFQQGEEIGLGARIFVDKGYIKGDRSFGIHVRPSIPTGYILIKEGPNNASVDWFKVKVYGRSAHVSSPEKGINALFTACNIIHEIQTIVDTDREGTLIGVGKLNAGTAYNIIADYAEFEGTIRAFDENIRKSVKAKIELISKKLTDDVGGDFSIEWKDNTSALSNDEIVTAEIQNFAVDLFGNEKIITEAKPSLSGDDFAEFIKKVPGTYCYIGSSDIDDKSTQNDLHNECFNIDEKCLITSSKLMIGETLDFLS